MRGAGRRLRRDALVLAGALLAGGAPAQSSGSDREDPVQRDRASREAPVETQSLTRRGPVVLCGSAASQDAGFAALSERPVRVLITLTGPEGLGPEEVGPEEVGPGELELELQDQRFMPGAGELPRLSAPPATTSDGRELAAWVEALPAEQVVFVLAGGDPARWARALFPGHSAAGQAGGRALPLLSSLWHEHASGAAILATGGAARAFSGAAILTRNELGERYASLRNPRKRGQPVLYWGLAFFPWALVEIPEEAPPRVAGPGFERFVLTLHGEGLHFGLFLPRGSAVLGRSADDRFRGLGPEPALVLDLRPARRSKGWLLDARLSELGTGDEWSGEFRAVRHPDGAPLADRAGTLTFDADALDHAAIERTLRALAASSAARAELRAANTTVRLEIDEDTRLAAGRLHAVRMDVLGDALGR